MGRKEDEEEQSKVSKDTNGSCIEELTKKCKPVNVQLSRLELPKNGVILLKDNASEKLKEVHLNCNEGELSDSNSNIDKVENEENSNDTAETIKKIKEFIALGRCEETKKDQDSSGKNVDRKVRVLTKRKLLNKKDSKIPIKKSATVLDGISEEHELERTLKGQDTSDCINTSNSQENDRNEFVKGQNRKPSIDIDESQTSDYTDSTVKNDLLFTPSRVSKRIQSKSVKFSVKKMLRGDDVNVLKRMIPGYEDKTPSKKDRSTEKKVKSEIKKHAVSKSPSPPPREPSEERGEAEVPEVSSAACPAVTTSHDSPEISEPPQETPEPTILKSVESIIENKDKFASLTDKIGKFAIGNGQITVELKGSQQKKVRIALPPANTQSLLPNTSLGPDIIIKRVKPVKKTVVMPDKPTLSAKGIPEKELTVEQSSPNIKNILKDNKTPRIDLERMTKPKLKEKLAKMRKNILRRGRTDKRIGKSDSKEMRKPDNVKGRGEANATSSDSEEEFSPSKEKNKVSGVTLSDNMGSNDSIKSLDQIEKVISPGSPEKVDSTVQEESQKVTPMDKTRGRKTAKVTPLTQVKSKNETATKKPLSKVKKLYSNADDVIRIEPVLAEPEKETYKNLFDRYFSTDVRLVENYDCFDSDSSEDCDDDIYAHFINLRKRKEALDEEKKEETVTMYDLMHDIALELPTWNIHVMSDGQAFCLAQVDIVSNVPVMKKAIEIDLDYNVKVFIEGTLMSEYDGNYSGYEDIRQLIYDVDRL